MVPPTGSEDELEAQLEPVAVLYRDHALALVRVAYLLCGSRAVAEDVVHDAFTHLYQNWHRVDLPTAYLRVSVINGCRTHHRRAIRERSRFADLVRLPVSTETPMIMDAVAKLPYRQRAALILRYFEDRPDTEIADALGCRPATVRSLIHRGLVSLREAIER